MAIKLIVAVDKNFGIGYKGDLLFRVSEDLKHFRKLTEGHYVVMGRKTFDSLEKALPKRKNVVLTRTPFKPLEHNVIVETSIQKLLNHYIESGSQEKDLWIIGGAEIYKQFLPYADEVHMTLIHAEAEKVDTYFPVNEMRELGLHMTQSDSLFSDTGEREITFAVYVKSPKVT